MVLKTLKVPEKLQLYGLCVSYVVHICDFGMVRVKLSPRESQSYALWPKALALRAMHGFEIPTDS